MQSKSITKQSELLNLITPKTLACLWVSEESLYKREAPFLWFNYLLDGNLEFHLKHLPPSPKSLFTAQHYGEVFYLLQVEKSFPDLNKALHESFQIIKPDEGKNEVICLARNRQHFTLPFIKENKDITFQMVLY